MNSYIIITPAKNECDYIDKTIESVINQTILPKKWIIVDDSSTDNTAQIIESYTVKYPWIFLLKLAYNNEPRSGGSKVVNAFNQGYNLIKYDKYDFIVKLDSDLVLPSNYFEVIINAFINDSKIGLVGGIIMNKVGDKLIQEGSLNYHIRGAFKTYRKKCFEDIGGFKPIWNWDGLDEMEAMYKGWMTKTINLKVVHLRPTTSAYNLKFHALKSGYEAYRMRMSGFLLLGRVFVKIKEKPYFIYAVYYLHGYLTASFERADYLIDKKLANFINKFHAKRLLNKLNLFKK